LSLALAVENTLVINRHKEGTIMSEELIFAKKKKVALDSKHETLNAAV